MSCVIIKSRETVWGAVWTVLTYLLYELCSRPEGQTTHDQNNSMPQHLKAH